MYPSQYPASVFPQAPAADVSWNGEGNPFRPRHASYIRGGAVGLVGLLLSAASWVGFVELSPAEAASGLKTGMLFGGQLPSPKWLTGNNYLPDEDEDEDETAVKNTPVSVEQLPKLEPDPSAGTPKWVMAAPPPETQTSLTSEERGGNACLTADPGFGSYGEWDRSPRIGQMLVPERLQLNADSEFQLVFHFHGHDAARKEWVRIVDDAVLVGIDLGNGSDAYRRGFAQPEVFSSLLHSVEEGVSESLGRDVTAGRIALTSWSAGYGATLEILKHDAYVERIDAVVLLDGLHAPYTDSGQVDPVRMQPIVDFAKRSQAGEKLLFVTHSSIVPPGYASTTETANYLMWQLGNKPSPVTAAREYPLGLEPITDTTDGDLHIRGFKGNGKQDHCAQVALLSTALEEHLVPRWDLTRPQN